MYLGANISTVSYVDIRQRVEKRYQHFEEQSPFDNLHNQLSSLPPSAIQSELVTLLQFFKILLLVSLWNNLLDQSSFDNASGRGQNNCSIFYHMIYCYICCKEGYYFTSCNKPVVSKA